jgi:uncharacterized membrane protein
MTKLLHDVNKNLSMTFNFVVEYFILDIFWNTAQSLIYRIKIALSPTGFLFLCILLLPILFSMSTVAAAIDELQGDFHLVYMTNDRAEG